MSLVIGGFAKGKLCLTNLVTFYGRVTVLVDRDSRTDFAYLYLCQVFDTALQNALVSKLEGYEFDGWTIGWIKSWLDDKESTLAPVVFLGGWY